MAVTSDDVITAEAVRDEAEFHVEKNKVFRNAFRQIDSTNVNSNSIEIPVASNTTDPVTEVDEGTEYPRDDEATNKVTISHNKYGREVAITWEAIEDGLLDTVAYHAKDQAEDLARGLDQAAADVSLSFDDGAGTYDNLQDAAVGDAAGDLGYSEVVDAMAALESEGYQPDLLIVGPDAKGDLLKSEEFTRASEMGDDAIRSGAFGEIAGTEVQVSNRTVLGAGEAVMYDSDHYGFESVRVPVETEEYDEEETDERVIKVRTRMGWAVTRPDAGVFIEG